MNVEEIKEHEDGSATYTFDMTEEERKLATEQGLLWMIVAGVTGVTPESVLKEWIDKQEKE